MRRRDLLTAAPAVALATPSLAQGKKPLRFIPQANLTSVDPIWTTAVVTYEHAYMVYDKLYGWDGTQIRPQMAAGHEVSQDELTWTFTLRDGLMFHDKEPVLAKDCAQSIRRWGSRDSFGQVLMRYVNEVVPVSDKKFEIRLKKRCPQLLFGFGARQSFIMPERVAMTPGTQQITDYTGSGPFRFLKDEWVSGARAAYAKFEGYVPRQEQPSFFAGGKVAHFDRVEWTIQPDPATAAAALQKGETDWLDQPLIDLVPMLNKSPGVYTKVTDKGGWMIFMMLNHLNPPFNNPMVRQAVFAAMDQRAFAESAAGDQANLMVVPTGLFSPAMGMANTAGLERLSGPRNIEAAKKMVAESGYKGEPVVLLAPTDYPSLKLMSDVARELFVSIGLKVDYQAMDFGSVVTRRASQAPLDQGGWSAFPSIMSSLTAANPGSMLTLRGNGRQGWFGWPTDEKIETLREAWFDAPDFAAQKSFAEQIQLQYFQSAPFMLLCRLQQPTAVRNDIQGILDSSWPVFWGVKRV